MSSHQTSPLHGAMDAYSILTRPTEADVIRYRYAHGVNLGSIFVQEKWLTGAFYPPDCFGTSELAAVEGWVRKEGLEKTRERYQKFWKDYVSDADLDWLRDSAKCNAVRLPIGFFTLGPAYCHGTAFEEVSSIYQNAWDYVKLIIKRCHQRGIGTLIDFHALPGGANRGDHSGTNSGKAEFWQSTDYKTLATRCLCVIAHLAQNIEGVVGTQLVNEAEVDAAGSYIWYDEVLAEFSKISSAMPVCVSDAWNLATAVSWAGKKNKTCATGNPVVIDTHLYWCFTDTDARKSALQIMAEVQSTLQALDSKEGKVLSDGAAQVVVGEYSCVLADQSWSQDPAISRNDLVRAFGNCQGMHYQRRAGGAYMWTFRMDWMPGGQWGFKQMTDDFAVLPTIWLTLSVEETHGKIAKAVGEMQGKKRDAVDRHCNYWDSSYPGPYEHWRFALGWSVGFSDAMVFLGMRGASGLYGADKIGMLELWILKRLRESGMVGQLVWEFEEGLRQGVTGFNEAVGM